MIHYIQLLQKIGLLIFTVLENGETVNIGHFLADAKTRRRAEDGAAIPERLYH